jgi:ribosome recycling factor
MYKEVMKDAESRMKKAVEIYKYELQGIRTGRASPLLVERLEVDYYGTMTPLNQLAAITVPEPHLISIKPWDISAIKAIEKAILKSELGLTPNNDGKVIRLVVPPLTEERRRELVKLVHAKTEEAKVAIRNVRRDAIEDLRKMEKAGDITEDDLKDGKEEVQELTDKYIEEIEKLEKQKEDEIMEV